MIDKIGDLSGRVSHWPARGWANRMQLTELSLLIGVEIGEENCPMNSEENIDKESG